ncbi:hypothetical protein JCM10213_001749 [Rhodosporidiobolus nylandii]
MASTTVTILPTRLSLVHVPLALKNQLMANILDCWWYRREDDPFFALCSNGVELSLFADSAAVARCFAQYMDGGGTGGRSGSRSGSSSSSFSSPLEAVEERDESRSRMRRDLKGKGRAKDVEEKVVVGADRWVALEIALGGGNGWEEAGPRVHSLSAPLAARGISILFLSTFSADFILVRASSLPLVTSILEQEGFAFADPVDEREEREVESFFFDEEDEGSGTGGGLSTRRESREGGGLASMTGSLVLSDEGGGERNSPSASLTRSRNPSPAASRSNSLNLNLLRSSSMTSAPSSPLDPLSPTLAAHAATAPADPTPVPSPSIHAPPGRSLSLLPDELVCVGLSLQPNHETLWRQRVVEMLFFPERLLSSPSSSLPHPVHPSADPSHSHGRRTSASAADAVRPTSLQAPPTPFIALTQTPESASLTADIRLLRASFLDPSRGGGGGGGSTEDALFVLGVGGLGGPWEGEAGVKLRGGGLRPPTRGGCTSSEDESALSGSEASGEGEPGTEDDSECETSEEVSASEGGDEAEEWEAVPPPSDEGDDDDDDDEADSGERTLLKCLQLDLIRFGLDKPGLVEHYASLLISSGVSSLLYQSTFGSANILVAKRDVAKARAVLARG